MSVLVIAAALGALLLAAAIYFKFVAGWRRAHRAIVGGLTMCYGMWLALCTGTVMKLVVPGIGAMVLGSAGGVGVGFLTFLAVGVVGVATGGIGIALGALGMMSIGAVVGGVGAAAGGAFVIVPLVSPVFWAPIIFVGVYLLVGSHQKRRLSGPPKTGQITLPDA